MTNIIALDAGHGGFDPGSMGQGLVEKTLTLDIVLRLRTLLEFNRFKVVLTRDGDYAPSRTTSSSIDLNYRASVAVKAVANLLISVHINATPGGTGGETLYYSNKSIPFAKVLQKHLIQHAGWRDRGVKYQNLGVLRGVNNYGIPAVLSENGFIDNPSDAKRLSNPEFRQQIAVAHAKAVCEYFNQSYSNPTNKEDDDMLPTVILKHTESDHMAACDVSDKLGGGIPMLTSIGPTCKIPQIIFKFHKVYKVGGPSSGHPNETLLSGNDKYATIAAVAKFIRS